VILWSFWLHLITQTFQAGCADIQACGNVGINFQSVYIDNHWVAQQYIEQCKKGGWEYTEEVLKCWNLERIIDAEQQEKDAPSWRIF
jgi:hypothetical protein